MCSSDLSSYFISKILKFPAFLFFCSEVLEFSCSAAVSIIVSKCLFALFTMSIFYAGLIISLLLIIIFFVCEFVGGY